MTPNHRNTNKRNAKRKAETPDEEIDEVEVRPQRKKQRQSSSSNHKENSSVTAVTPVTAKPTTSLQKHLVGLYNEITSLMDHEGRLVASDFLKLPPKKRYPDYYTTIKNPIALDTILSRIENDEYDDTEALKADLTLMTSNAKKYNQKGSSIYEDAVTLQRIVKDYSTEVPHPLKVTLRQMPQKEKQEKSRLLASMTPKQTIQQAQEDIMAQIENVKEPRTKRVYSEIFMDAPSKKEYPEYYAYIQRVICLNEIKRNMKKGLYRTWTEFEADISLVWANAMAFNEDGSQVYEDAKILKGAFEKALKEKKAELGDIPESHLKLKFNLQQPQPQPPPTKIKLHVPQQTTQAVISPPAAPEQVKKESPILPPKILPPRPATQTVRQGSPLKNQITTSPSKSPPSLRPAPPKPTPPIIPSKEPGIPLTDWARTPQVTPSLQLPRHLIPQNQPNMVRPQSTPQLAPSRTGVIIPPSQENGVRPMGSLMLGHKRERSLTLIPLITLSTPSPPETPSSTPSQTSSHALLLNITSPPPPAPSTQTLCLTVPKSISELTLTAYLTKDLTLHGSYTFTVTANGRKLSPTIWPDSASRRSGTTDSISVTRVPPPMPTVPSGNVIGDMWKFGVVLGEAGSITSVEAGCTAFLKRDERGLLVRGERSRTGIAAGEDGGELERVVVLILRGR